MKKELLTAGILILSVLFGGCSGSDPEPATLKKALADKFLIGVAMNAAQIEGADHRAVEIIRTQYSSIVAENCMKPEELQPREGEFDFELADKFVNFGERNGMFIIGHTLIWHSQLPAWFTVDENGRQVSREVLIDRTRTHIHTVVGRYRGRVHGWDVVNEAIMDDGSFRQSAFYRIIGEDYIRLAFEFAHEADPEAELYYNDYSMFHPGKRDGVVNVVNNLKSQGVRIDAIGMQGHMGMDYPSPEAFELSMQQFIRTGADIMITEFDMSALPTVHMGADISDRHDFNNRLDPYPDGLLQEVADAWNERMQLFFNLFMKYSGNLRRVTLWGLTDGDSWKNDFPVPGRKDYPLLYDRNYQPKPIVEWLQEQ